jgi:hypothetical protein
MKYTKVLFYSLYGLLVLGLLLFTVVQGSMVFPTYLVPVLLAFLIAFCMSRLGRNEASLVKSATTVFKQNLIDFLFCLFIVLTANALFLI